MTQQALGHADEQDATPGKALRRRGILAAAGAVVAGIAAKQMSEPVAAATAVTLANDVGSILNNETVSTYLHNTGNNVFKHTDAAVLGESDNGPGVYGSVNFAKTPQVPFSVGVYGDHGSASGIGVHGMCAAESGTGVLGQGDAVSGIGVVGTSSAGTGVEGVSVSGFPMVGVTTTGANANAGVLGVGTLGPGVQGQSYAGHGLVGTTAATDGVHIGLVGYVQPGSNAIAVRGSVAAGAVGYAGIFDGDVLVNGALRVFGSPKNAAVKHPGDGTYRLLYCEESPESWFADYGEGTLIGDKAQVKLDPDFAALVHADAYHVFLTAHGPQHLHVAQRNATGFEVQAMAWATQAGGPKATVGGGTFSWRVVAKRKDIAGERLARVAAPPPLKPVTPFTVPVTPEVKLPTKKP